MVDLTMVDAVTLRKFKSIVKKWIRLKRKPSSKQPQVVDEETDSQNDEQQAVGETQKRRYISGCHSFRCNGDTLRFNTRPTGIRNNGCFPSRSKSRGRESCEPVPILSSCKSMNYSRTFSKALSRRNSTSIMFSNSSGLLKPPAVERSLECSLEDLCHGCTKKISLTRDIVSSDGYIDQKEEILTIDVQPGWKRGTKVIFEGKENERHGGLASDIVFIVSEKTHPLFIREGDDLELTLEIPLTKALTGGELSIPLLGGETMELNIDDVIYPGYEKIVNGEGMPNSMEHNKRGNLKLIFLVDFPTHLTDEQRFEIVSILQDSSNR